jgi:Na+/H+ antiporter NhaD/arsenite permease-like protein
MHTTLVVFVLVYAGMILGGLPGLALDRTGIALLGAIALVATGVLSTSEAWNAVDVPTIALLFALMIVSAQLELSGFYARVTQRIAALEVSPERLLLVLIAVAGGLSALLANDIVCLAMAPLLVAGCSRRGLDPRPYLLALAAAANVGSASTLIGNPQNMLIGQALGLSFARYSLFAGPPAVLALGVVFLVVRARYRGAWRLETRVDDAPAREYESWQTTKGLVAAIGLSVLFIASPWPREALALAAAGWLLASRRRASRALLGAIDGQLLVLFVGLFVVHHAFAATGTLGGAVAALRERGIDPARPAPMFVTCAALSNLVSNVPSVMLLLPLCREAPGGVEHAGSLLALASTFSGNLLLVGSIANLIVVDQARRLGISIGWREHARVGIPITLGSLALAAGWLALLASRA